MINIESAITTNNNQSPYIWLINQDHVPFDMSSDAHGTYYQLYHEFLKDIKELYQQTGNTYYFYIKGKLHSDKGNPVIPVNHIKLDKSKLRDIKLIELLS